MANNIPQFKTDLLAFFTGTSTFDATTKTKFRDAVVSEYNSEWIIFLGAQLDTAARRGEFGIKKIFDWMKERVESASSRANVAALPPVDTIS